MKEYVKPNICVVDIDADDLMDQFGGLPNSVRGDSIEDPTFEDNDSVDNSIWN